MSTATATVVQSPEPYGSIKRRFAKHFELATGAGRMPGMEGLRGFAAFIVFFVHFHSLFAYYAPPSSPILEISATLATLGNAGVDLFFVVSGYLIYGILLGKPSPIVQFLWRRIRRLYPVFLLMLSIYVFLQFAFPSYRYKLPHDPWSIALYLGANILMLPGVVAIAPLITVAWSLSYELFFYCALAILVKLLRFRTLPAAARVAIIAAVAVGMIATSFTRFVWCPRMVMFAGGILVWEMEKAGRFSGWIRSRSVEIAVAVSFLAVLLLIGKLGHRAGTSAVPIGAIFTAFLPFLFVTASALTAFVLLGRGLLYHAFSRDYLRWFGNMSYSFYLSHGLMLHGCKLLANRAFGIDPLNTVAYVAMFAVTFLIASLAAASLFLFVEKPLSLTKKPQPAARAAVVQPASSLKESSTPIISA